MQQQSNIQKGWLRVVLFLLCYLLLILFSGSVWNVLLSESVEENRLKTIPSFYFSILLNFFISLVMVLFFRRVVDRKTVYSLGLQQKGFTKEAVAGLLTGILINGSIATVLWLMQLMQWFTATIDPELFFYSFLLLVLVAIGEELVFRGYVLNNLLQSIPKEAALLLSAIIFAVFHSLNPNFNLTAFLNILLAGILLGVNYIFTRNLWFGFLFHFTWNFVQGLVLGFPVSGLDLPTLLEQDSKGSVLLTGGAFGLEASWLATIFLALVSLILYLQFQKKYSSQPLV